MPARHAPLALALVVLAAGCSGEPQQTPTPQRPGTVLLDGETANDHGTEQAGGTGEVMIEAGDLFFAPTVLLGPAGLARMAVVRNGGAERHTFTSPDLGVDHELDPGQEVELEVRFPDSGTAVFFCRFHRGEGMLGALVAT